MLRRGVFITGTDTGVGKTLVASLLAASFKEETGIRYFKPVQTGTDFDEDTATVIRAAGLNQDEYIAPVFRFRAPMSPDRAAALENKRVDLDVIQETLAGLHDRLAILEGAGGLEVPLNEKEKISDLVKKLNLPVLIVASTRLGTINHTLLTVEAVRRAGAQVIGVVLSGADDVGLEEVLRREGADVLFHIPAQEKISIPDLAREFAKPLRQLREKIENLSKPEMSIAKLDQEHVWHPFTQHAWDAEFPVAVSGCGSQITLSTGETLIDAISSWWVNLHGHGRREIAEAIGAQAAKLEHVVFAGYTHEPATQLARRLLELTRLTQPSMSKVFYSDNGSTAVEVALKMAYQFHIQKGSYNRRKFLALRGSYHGDTFGAMSVSEREGFHQVFKPLMAPVDFIEPDDFAALDELTAQLDEYAAVIFEPLLQGAGGMRKYSEKFLQALAEKCQAHEVLLVADEIFTGFYRTGTFLACDHAKVHPDLICLSKGLSGGFLPLAVTVASNDVFETFKGETLSQAFLHGHSYTANPIACAAALASLDILSQPECRESIASLARWTHEAVTELKDFPYVVNARSIGTVGAFDLQGKEGYFAGDFAKKFAERCHKHGVLIRPLGGTVYTVPPYSTTREQFGTVYKAIRETLLDMQRGSL